MKRKNVKFFAKKVAGIFAIGAILVAGGIWGAENFAKTENANAVSPGKIGTVQLLPADDGIVFDGTQSVDTGISIKNVDSFILARQSLDFAQKSNPKSTDGTDFAPVLSDSNGEWAVGRICVIHTGDTTPAVCPKISTINKTQESNFGEITDATRITADDSTRYRMCAQFSPGGQAVYLVSEFHNASDPDYWLNCYSSKDINPPLTGYIGEGTKNSGGTSILGSAIHGITVGDNVSGQPISSLNPVGFQGTIYSYKMGKDGYTAPIPGDDILSYQPAVQCAANDTLIYGFLDAVSGKFITPTVGNPFSATTPVNYADYCESTAPINPPAGNSPIVAAPNSGLREIKPKKT